MKKIPILFVVFLLFWFSTTAQELNLEQVLQKYYQATGSATLQKINTIVQSGTNIQQDAMPVEITRMRPDRLYIKFDVQDVTAYQVFDGQTAWWTTPWTGNPKPQVMPEERTRDLRSRADFDGLLWDWKNKGHMVEMAGTDTVKDQPAWRIKVTRKDGGTEYFSIDMKSCLLVKRLTTRIIRGNEVPTETIFSDFRMASGIMFPFSNEIYFGGQLYSTAQFDTIELNVPVDETIFRMPENR